MKTKDKETKKNHSIEELRSELRQLQEKKFKMTFKHRVTPLTNPMELRALRRDIARINTWIRAKQLSAGKTK